MKKIEYEQKQVVVQNKSVKCKREQYDLRKKEKWCEDNPPKYKVGDIVEVTDMHRHDFTNSYFRVERVIKHSLASGNYTWYYEGERCYKDNDGFHLYEWQSVEEDSIRLVMTCEEYNKKVEELMNIYKCKYKSHVRFCRNRKGFEVFIPYNEEKN
jgi:hypothetical protein